MYFDKLLYLFLFRNRETNYHVWHKEYMYIYTTYSIQYTVGFTVRQR